MGMLCMTHQLLTRKSLKINDKASPAPEAPAADDAECCGQHTVCTKRWPPVTEIVYYDDDELDAFAGHDPSSYTEAEIEQFRAVLTTLLDADVPGWLQSLQLRNIALPTALRDEALLLLSDH